MQCPNTNSPQWQKLVSKIGERGAFREYMTLGDIPDPGNYANPANIEPEPGLDKKIQSFLEKLGISVQKIDAIRDAAGSPLPVTAKADILNRVIEVVAGRQSLDTLPEEAAHFFVELIGSDHSLYKEMFSKITSYQLYKDTVSQYKDLPQYRNPNGSVNFDKLKKEAIGKLIATHIIRLETGTETGERLGVLMDWWKKIWKLISDIFSQADNNPFEESAERILSGNTSDLSFDNASDEVFFQVDDSIAALIRDQARIQLDNSVDKRTGQKRHIYTVDGKPVKGSVTTVKVDAYYRKIFPSDKRSEFQKEIDLLKAEFGDVIHAEVEHIFDQLVDPGTHLVREQPLDTGKKFTTDIIYATLHTYMKGLVGTYPQGTRFMTEVKIFDPKQDMAGSIDLVVIKPDNSVDIYDWKSQEVGKDQTDIKTFKEPAYRIQLGEYRRILSQYYGFEKFGKVRAIPIKTNYKYRKEGDNFRIDTLQSIEMGDVNPENIPLDKDYLLPVTLSTETSDDDHIDSLVTKLNGIYEKIKSQRAKGEEKFAHRDRVERYRTAIRDLQLRKDVRKLIDLGFTEISKYHRKLQQETITPGEALESERILEVFASTTGHLGNMFAELKKTITNEQEQAIYDEILEKYNSMNSRAAFVKLQMEEYKKKVAKAVAEEHGIKNVLGAEREVGMIKGLFGSLSTLPTKMLRLFYDLLRDSQNTRDVKYDQNNNKLAELKGKLVEWAKAKGISVDNMFDGILQFNEKGKWNGNFVSKYKKEFYEQREDAIKTGNVLWLSKNTVFDPEKFKTQKEKVAAYYKDQVFHPDPEENAKRQSFGFNKWVKEHSVTDAEGNMNPEAYLNKNNQFLRPAAQWETDKWKELNKPDNKPLLDTYEYFQSLVKESTKLGMLDEYAPGFIPFMFRSKVDQLATGDWEGAFSGKGFFEGLQVEGTDYFPEVDPIDGKIVNRVPVYFVKDQAAATEDGPDYSNKSKDLFKVFSIWGGHMYNYEAMSSIEDTANLLLSVEQGKESIVTGMFGTASRKEGVVETQKTNKKNADLLETFVEYYLYNRRSGSEKDQKFTVNGKEYSASRSFQAMIRYFTMKTLALNPISGAAQFVGGTGNALLVGSKRLFFTNSDWAKANYLLGKKDDKAVALLDYFDVLLEDQKQIRSNNLSVSTLTKNLTTDKLFVLMRTADRAVQYPVAVSMLLNHMVAPDGNIVDILDHVKAKYNYNTTFYNLPEAERKRVSALIEKEVEELKQSSSLYNSAKIENDRLVIPGLKDELSMGKFRSKVKKVNKIIVGNSTHDDINKIRTTTLGMAFMNFRSWMPQMVQERFDGLRYDVDLEKYQMGKTALFFSEIFSKRSFTLLKGLLTDMGSGDVIEAAKVKYQMKKAEAFELGEDFTITEGEFIDMYIGNIRSQFRELLIIVGLMSLILSLGMMGDDDEEYSGVQKYANRALHRFYTEFAFYYNPLELTKLMKSPLPFVGLAEDFFRFTDDLIGQGVGVISGSDEMIKENRPLKYFYRMVPITKEVMNMTAIFDDDFRKEWNIKL